MEENQTNRSPIPNSANDVSLSPITIEDYSFMEDDEEKQDNSRDADYEPPEDITIYEESDVRRSERARNAPNGFEQRSHVVEVQQTSCRIQKPSKRRYQLTMPTTDRKR